jgi:cytidyltransferase-like protein
MNSKIITYDQAANIINGYRKDGKIVVLSHGCFDVIHVGHVISFREAKSSGDILFVGLENDETIRKNKGEGRPFHTLAERLDFLSELKCIDYVFGFPKLIDFSNTKEFEKRYSKLAPTSIAISEWDPSRSIKEKQCKNTNILPVILTQKTSHSTTKILKIFGAEN